MARRKSRVERYEFFGQCSRCLDFFSLYLIRFRQRYTLEENPRIKHIQYPDDRPTLLIHRPGFCNGKVKVFAHESFLLKLQQSDSKHHSHRDGSHLIQTTASA